uniref:(northern house mosquito) hypothetical protein n=1 Tax=Culex pipiens TaxID=7175 RepID=A0A8D8CQA2_CULPI
MTAMTCNGWGRFSRFGRWAGTGFGCWMPLGWSWHASVVPGGTDADVVGMSSLRLAASRWKVRLKWAALHDTGADSCWKRRRITATIRCGSRGIWTSRPRRRCWERCI